ncbi:hypothetical protein HNR74_003200 [Flammeovirga kamogawensis]|nr:hypothetical protein [Flammeovirga kamogawensis]
MPNKRYVEPVDNTTVLLKKVVLFVSTLNKSSFLRIETTSSPVLISAP